MSDLLGIGSSGLAAYRAALNAVGENVANAESAGYARRSVTLKPSQAGGGADLVYRQGVVFNGVAIGGVTRAWDEFRATEARYAAAAAGRAEVREQWLTGIEAALDDGPGGIGAAMGNFFNAATTLAAQPDDPLGRSAMLMVLADVAGAFRTTAGALARVSDGVAEAAGLDVTAVNNALSALHNLNGTIRAVAPGGTARASMEDERDRLIDFIAQRLDVVASIAGDGTAGLSLAGASAVDLLTGQGPGFVAVARAADGRLALQLTIGGTTAPLPAAEGRLAGLVDVAAQAADRRAALDALAVDFAAAINAWSAAGTDADGNAGGDLIEAPAGAASAQALVADPALIAAGSATAANGNLLALETVRNGGAFEARWTGIVSGNAQALASARSEAAAAASWRDTSLAALDEVTGVDLDREAADLLRYQQAYNGAARIIQVARETLDEIFRLF